MNTLLKLFLSVLFMLCLLEMPYGFYQLVRFVSTIAFLYLAYYEYVTGSKYVHIIYLALALLFQPFLKIALGRSLWNIVDVIVALWLIATLFINSKPRPYRQKENHVRN